MQRVNRLYATLSDGDQRRRYDITLNGMTDVVPARRQIGVRLVPSFAWLICAVLGIGGIGWYAAQDPARSPAVPAPSPARFERLEMHAGGFAGAWFYPGAIIEGDGVAPYAAESIEMLIAEEQGKIRGSFHGQYSIPRRTLPSEVNFSFAGSRGGPIAVLPWWGDHGAAGELQLRQLTEDSIEVVWAAAETGKFLPLSSGTATLIRKKTR